MAAGEEAVRAPAGEARALAAVQAVAREPAVVELVAAERAAEEGSFAPFRPSLGRRSGQTSRFAHPARFGTRSVANASFGAATSCQTPK